MKKLQIVALIAIVLSVSINSSAAYQNNNYCPPDVDAGALLCRSSCDTAISCRSSQQLPVGSYCWLAYSVSGTHVIACHQGEYDPCCDPNRRW